MTPEFAAAFAGHVAWCRSLERRVEAIESAGFARASSESAIVPSWQDVAERLDLERQELEKKLSESEELCRARDRAMAEMQNELDEAKAALRVACDREGMPLELPERAR